MLCSPGVACAQPCVLQTFLSFRQGGWEPEPSAPDTDPESDCQCQLLVSIAAPLRLQPRKSSVCSIDPRLSVAPLLHPDLSIDKPGVVLFPPKWGGRSEGLEGTPRSLQTWGTVLIRIYEQYFSLRKVNLGLGKFYCCWYGNGFNDGFELKPAACPTFL